MTTAIIAPTDLVLSVLAPERYDEHMKAWRWHEFLVGVSPNYLAEIAVRQAAKRAAGIGPEGMCRA
jgi:hypothetical protein